MFRTGISVWHAENSDGTRRLRFNGSAVRASWSRDESLLVVRWGSNRVAIQYVIADEKIRDFEGDLLNG